MGITRKQSTPNFPKNEQFLPPDKHTHVRNLSEMFSLKIYRKIQRALFSCNTRFKIHLFALSPTNLFFLLIGMPSFFLLRNLGFSLAVVSICLFFPYMAFFYLVKISQQYSKKETGDIIANLKVVDFAGTYLLGQQIFCMSQVLNLAILSLIYIFRV